MIVLSTLFVLVFSVLALASIVYHLGVTPFAFDSEGETMLSVDRDAWISELVECACVAPKHGPALVRSYGREMARARVPGIMRRSGRYVATVETFSAMARATLR